MSVTTDRTRASPLVNAPAAARAQWAGVPRGVQSNKARSSLSRQSMGSGTLLQTDASGKCDVI
jgi:hypothetical protein